MIFFIPALTSCLLDLDNHLGKKWMGIVDINISGAFKTEFSFLQQACWSKGNVLLKNQIRLFKLDKIQVPSYQVYADQKKIYLGKCLFSDSGVLLKSKEEKRKIFFFSQALIYFDCFCFIDLSNTPHVDVFILHEFNNELNLICPLLLKVPKPLAVVFFFFFFNLILLYRVFCFFYRCFSFNIFSKPPEPHFDL